MYALILGINPKNQKTMRKVALTIVAISTIIQTNAQVAIPYPSMAEFDAFKSKELNGAIKYAEDLKNFKINIAEFKPVGKSGIVGFRREETYSIDGWPNDGCSVRYFYDNPKVVNGIKIKMEVVAEFKRSYCESEKCYLQNTWKPFVVNAMPFYEDLGMTKKDAEDLAMICVKSKYSKDSLLKDYIQFNAIELKEGDAGKYHFEKIINSNTVEFRFGISGEVGGYYQDRSICVTKAERSGDWYTYILKFENGKWNVVTSLEKYNRMFSSNDMSLYNKPLPEKRFTPYSEASFDEIYQKTKEGTIPANAPINSLKKANEDFVSFLIANSDNLTKEKLMPYFLANNDEYQSDVNWSIENILNNITPSDNGKIKYVNLIKSNYRNIEEVEISPNQIFQKGTYGNDLTAKKYIMNGKKLKENGEGEINLYIEFLYTKDGWKVIKIQS